MDTHTRSTANVPSGEPTRVPRLFWVDLVRALAVVWIFTNHFTERIFGSPYIANPSADWPPLAERISQLQPLQGYGILNLPVNLLRYLGWFGDQGVQLFLIASGFGLTWGLLSRQGSSPIHLRSFFRRRMASIYPMWWGVHLLFGASWVLLGWGLSLSKPATYLSMLGIRITPELFYYFSPAWWFIGLLLQLYLFYPILWEGLRRLGPERLLVASCLVAFPVRALGLLELHGYVDPWQRGAVFITRLPEFAFGIALASWYQRDPNHTKALLGSMRTCSAGIGLYVLGTALSLTMFGMTFAPFLTGFGALVLIVGILGRSEPSRTPFDRIWAWTSRHTYSLYLVQHPFILALVPAGASIASTRVLIGVSGAAVLTIAAGLLLEVLCVRSTSLLGRWRREAGVGGTVCRLLAFGAGVAVILVGTELVVHSVAPQEVLGWGERPALEPDPILGWRLKPSTETRLRWETYDYVVNSNSLGFPGPEYGKEKGPNALRIMTLGDAFTSAEGVDTNLSWPRLLEVQLAQRLPGTKVEVMNFAVTGYGPNQYAAVAEMYAPVYKPDVILVGFFVNEYEDVLVSNEDFRQSIGFELPPQEGVYSLLGLSHLRRFIDLHFKQPIKELISGKPRSHGYFLGTFRALERGWPTLERGRHLVADRLGQIKEVADGIGARVSILLIPAPVQVCNRSCLAYYPRNLDLTDAARFDLEQPQRLTCELAGSVGLGCFDLLPLLRSGAQTTCPYQRGNMHWTIAGHQMVATGIAEAIIEGQDIFAPKRLD